VATDPARQDIDIHIDRRIAATMVPAPTADVQIDVQQPASGAVPATAVAPDVGIDIDQRTAAAVAVQHIGVDIDQGTAPTVARQDTGVQIDQAPARTESQIEVEQAAAGLRAITIASS